MWLLLLACVEKETMCERASEVEASLELGVGEKEFTPLGEGDALERVYGSQGGSHVWIAVLATGIHPGVKAVLGPDQDTPVVDVNLVDPADGTLYGEANATDFAFQGDEQEAELDGLRLYLSLGGYYSSSSANPPPTQFTLQAELQDVCGTSLTASHTVRLLD